jgi:glyoxylase-like metal-dependent hydrolase (beta-lactamase superfamily II)
VNENAIDLVAITHGHLDHAGAGEALQRELGAPIAVHEEDADMVRAGDSPVPEAQNLEGAVAKPFLDTKFPAFEPDLLFAHDVRLDDFGIPGAIVHLPAHTPGTIAIVLDSGDAFVGDLVRGVSEGARGEHEGVCDTHLFSEDPKADRAAMEALLARGVTTFFPGHGPMFDGDTVRGWLERTQTESDARERKPDVEVD